MLKRVILNVIVASIVKVRIGLSPCVAGRRHRHTCEPSSRLPTSHPALSDCSYCAVSTLLLIDLWPSLLKMRSQFKRRNAVKTRGITVTSPVWLSAPPLPISPLSSYVPAFVKTSNRMCATVARRRQRCETRPACEPVFRYSLSLACSRHSALPPTECPWKL
ncbi:hypothetical protein J6590_056208 [Homalodisca vitripennis]|nr:hypothetical protein J6590_056208 [Homalodisca vitripennis]